MYNVFFCPISLDQQHNVKVANGIRYALHHKDIWKEVTDDINRSEWFDTPTWMVNRIVTKDEQGVSRTYEKLTVFDFIDFGYRLILGYEVRDHGYLLTEFTDAQLQPPSTT